MMGFARNLAGMGNATQAGFVNAGTAGPRVDVWTIYEIDPDDGSIIEPFRFRVGEATGAQSIKRPPCFIYSGGANDHNRIYAAASQIPSVNGMDWPGQIGSGTANSYVEKYSASVWKLDRNLELQWVIRNEEISGYIQAVVSDGIYVLTGENFDEFRFYDFDGSAQWVHDTELDSSIREHDDVYRGYSNTRVAFGDDLIAYYDGSLRRIQQSDGTEAWSTVLASCEFIAVNDTYIFTLAGDTLKQFNSSGTEQWSATITLGSQTSKTTMGLAANNTYVWSWAASADGSGNQDTTINQHNMSGTEQYSETYNLQESIGFTSTGEEDARARIFPEGESNAVYVHHTTLRFDGESTTYSVWKFDNLGAFDWGIVKDTGHARGAKRLSNGDIIVWHVDNDDAIIRVNSSGTSQWAASPHDEVYDVLESEGRMYIVTQDVDLR